MDRRTALKTIGAGITAPATLSLACAAPPSELVTVEFNRDAKITNFEDIAKSPTLRIGDSVRRVLVWVRQKDAINWTSKFVWGTVILDWICPMNSDASPCSFTFEIHRDSQVEMGHQPSRMVYLAGKDDVPKEFDSKKWVEDNHFFINRTIFHRDAGGAEFVVISNQDTKEEAVRLGMIVPYDSLWGGEYVFVSGYTPDVLEAYFEKDRLQKELSKTKNKMADLTRKLASINHIL